MKIKTALKVAAATVLAGLTYNCTAYEVDEREQVVVTQFGKVQRTVSEPGFHVKLPWPIEAVNVYDKQLLRYEDDANRVPTKDKKLVVIDAVAYWQIDDPVKFRENLRTVNGAQSQMDNIIYSEARESISAYNMHEAIRSTNRTIISAEGGNLEGIALEQVTFGRAKQMAVVTEQSNAEMLPYGVQIMDVRFKRADLPQEVEQSVFERMESERKRISEKICSEGRAEALNIDGSREQRLAEVNSDAYKKAQTIHGEADAEALKIQAEAYEKGAKFFGYQRTLQAYENSFGPNSNLVLTTKNSKFLGFLKGN